MNDPVEQVRAMRQRRLAARAQQDAATTGESGAPLHGPDDTQPLGAVPAVSARSERPRRGRIAVLAVGLLAGAAAAISIPALADTILDTLGDRESPMARALAAGELLPELMRHGWPGNVRELRNYLEACLARQEFSIAPTPAAEPTIDISSPLRIVRERWVQHVERRYLEEVLAAHGGNVSAAARAAGIDRVHMHRLLSKAGLK